MVKCPVMHSASNVHQEMLAAGAVIDCAHTMQAPEHVLHRLTAALGPQNSHSCCAVSSGLAPGAGQLHTAEMLHALLLVNDGQQSAAGSPCQARDPIVELQLHLC